jgi:NAD(P)-dependent dehydrogenase (short-subunit alcohol dehydrogenase family)
VEHLVEMTVRDHGRLDGVVANAGVMVTGTVAETTAEDWQQALDVDLTGTFLLAKHSIPNLRRSGGAFVAVGSIAGVRAPRGAAAYAISKSAIGVLVAPHRGGGGAQMACAPTACTPAGCVPRWPMRR